MRVESNEIFADEQSKTIGRRTRPRDLTHQSFLLVALVAFVYSPHHSPGARALSLPGRRLFRRHATTTDSGTEIGHAFHRATDPVDEPFDLSERSPAFTSPLFTSPSHRRNRSGRQRLITQHRRKLLRVERNFQLNYKGHDDDLLNIIDSDQPIRPRIFGGRRRKSLSKALFPPVEQLSDVADVKSTDELDVVPDMMEDETFELPTIAMPVGLGKIKRKKKKNQVVVSNIKELHEAILDKGLELRDVELKYAPPPSLLSSKKQQTSDELEADPMATNSDDDLQLNLLTNKLNSEFEESIVVELNCPEMDLENNDEPNIDEWQLIGNVLAEDAPFPTEEDVEQVEEQIFSHDVLNLLHQRYHSQSTPMSRGSNDTAMLALSIEGGGMRGAVSGGMAAAIACLGLSNCFDSIYGSSAGSIIGSYFVSRQLYLDVYTDVIPAGKDLFVSKSKIFGDIFRNMFYVIKGPLGKKLNANLIERFRNPTAATNNTLSSVDNLPPTRAGGLNISFVLDSIMCPERGLRPLDLEAFGHNDAVQPLRIVSSAVEMETGKLKTICFGSKDGHFDQFAIPAPVRDCDDSQADSNLVYPEMESAQADENGHRRGLWACLGASMTVPGAAGSPFQMDLPNDHNEITPHLCFDAFCHDAVPIRSAVAEGATHVVALRSRPAGYEPKTKPTLYERAVAPLYFRSNGANTAAEFFEKGGQQYLYAEDILMCDEGLNSTEPIPIPPAKVLYAAPNVDSSRESTSDYDRETWARAHLLPITVPADVPELLVLSQDREEILAGIRSGFAAAYDALSPVVGLQAGPDSLDGMKIAELVFPEVDAPHESVLEKQIPLAGEKLGNSLKASKQETISTSTPVQDSAASVDLSSAPRRYKRFRKMLSSRRAFRRSRRADDHAKFDVATSSMPIHNDFSPPAQDADAVLPFLPGVQLGSIPMVAERFQAYFERQRYTGNKV